LSQRIARGRPWAQNAATKIGCTPAIVGAVMRTSISRRLWLSVIVSGSIRRWSRVRNQPLKSVAHSSLAATTAANGRGWSSARRRRRAGATRPARLRMSAIVEAAGQRGAGASRASIANSLRGPRCGNRRRSATIASATAGPVRCGQCRAACDRSANHAASPRARRSCQA